MTARTTSHGLTTIRWSLAAALAAALALLAGCAGDAATEAAAETTATGDAPSDSAAGGADDAHAGGPDVGGADAVPADGTGDAQVDVAALDASADTGSTGATDAGATDAGTPDTGATTDAADAAGQDADTGAETPPEGPCDPLDPTACALPWPSNVYLAPDPTRATGYALDFGATSLPSNLAGTHIDPAPYARLDGYSPGTAVLVHFPSLDGSDLPGEYHTDASLDPGAPVLWFEVQGDALVRVPYWAELDAGESNAAQKLLMVNPAVILKEGTRYVVAFRGLKDLAGAPIPPTEAFAKLRDGATADDPELAPRQARFDDVFALLEANGVDRQELVLAWDFVTGSSDALHGEMLHMRDDAFAAVGPSGPELTITEVEELSPEQNEYIAVELRGTFHVPSYMDPQPLPDGSTAWTMHRGPDGLPVQTGWRDEPLWIRIPRTALDGPPHGLIQYGHGLNGTGTQVRGSFNSRIASQHQFIFFACNMLGMSDEDVPVIIQITQDISHFPWLADRLHQGMLNHLLLARAMRERFPTLPEVTSRGITVNTDELFYSGISQGGIFGATYMALTQDVERGHLGVPGNHYAVLLQRSTDFLPFFAAVSLGYPGRTRQAMLLQAVQLLWDRVDPVTYYRHISAEPFPGNQAHQVLAAPAKGDEQVAVITNEIVARTDIGIPILAHYDTERVVQGAPEEPYPHVGSGIVLYAFGNPWPPEQQNLPPKSNFPDPHELPRKLDHHSEQMVHFFRTGEIIDVCGGDGCTPE